LADIELNCLVHGATPATDRVFPVVINRSKTVGTLEKLVKKRGHPELADLAADKLTLWGVSIPLDNNADNTLRQLMLRNDETKDIQKLHLAKRLSGYFSDEPAKEHVHVIIQPPSGNKIAIYFLIISAHIS
jgi:Crinkler effector protein N-terminal domain